MANPDVNKVYHRSLNQGWETPPALFNRLNEEFRFDIDAAANADNAKCRVWFDVAADGLKQLWSPFTVFCNPPYKDAALWVRKAALESRRGGATAVLLTGARTGTVYWAEWVWPEVHEIRFITRRVKFELNGVPCKDSASFDLAVLIYRPGLPPERPLVSAWDWRTDPIPGVPLDSQPALPLPEGE